MVAFVNLEEFYCAFNDLEDLFDFTYLENLEIVDLEGNNITSLDEVHYLENCSKLSFLTVTSNPLTKEIGYETKILKQLPQLEFLNDEKTSMIKENLGKKKQKARMDKNRESLNFLRQSMQSLSSGIAERLKILGGDEAEIENSINKAMEEMKKEPEEEELILTSIKNSKSRSIDTKFLSESICVSDIRNVNKNNNIRPSTAGPNVNMRKTTAFPFSMGGGADNNQDMQILDFDKNTEVEDCTSDLVRNTEEAFAGNPLRALKHNNKYRNKTTQDIHSLLHNFKIHSDFARDVNPNLMYL